MLNKEDIISVKVTGNGNIVVQNSDNTTITLDTNNVIELRKQISNIQEKLNVFNPEILQLMQQKIIDAGIKDLPIVDANIYFSIGIIMNGLTHNMVLSITITNLTKEHRYFNQPSFNLSHPYKGADSFILTTTIGEGTKFPIRLEYGQPVTVSYLIEQNQIDFFKEVMEQDGEASVAVVSSTTVGEIYRSNEHTIEHIISSYERIMGQ